MIGILQSITGLFFTIVFDFASKLLPKAGKEIPSAEIDFINFLRSII